MRVGSHSGNGGNGDGSTDGDSGLPPPPPPSACARVGGEVKIPTSGTDTFAWVWSRDHYVVVYTDYTAGAGDIYALTLNADGSLRSSPVAVEPTPAASILPNVVATQTGYLVAWEEGTAGQTVYVHALDENAQPVGQGTTIASTTAPEARPVLSAAPGGYAVAWMDRPQGVPAVEIAMLDQDLHAQAPVRVGQTAGFPWVAGDGDTAGMIWSDKSTGPYDIHFAELQTMPLGVTGEVPIRSGQMNDALLGRMIKTSFGYLAAWEDMRGDDNQIFMALIDESGNKFADGLVEEPNSGDANWPNMAWTGSSAGVVYYQFRDANPQIFISFVDGQGKRVGGLHDLQVSSTPSGHQARFPDVQWTGTEFGVAWVDTREGGPQLYFARVDCKG